MAAPQKKSQKASPKRKKSVKKKSKIQSQDTWVKKLIKPAMKISIAGIAFLSVYCLYLDAKITEKFEGQRWKLPAKVYARPFQLYPNKSIRVRMFHQELNLLGYQRVSHARQPGQYAASQHRIDIYLREFQFNDGYRPPRFVSIQLKNGQITQLLDHKNKPVSYAKIEPLLIERITNDTDEDREVISLEVIPEPILDALILVEDKNFYHHTGVSLRGIFRALIANVKAGKTVQGGSTLTQQLAKNFYLTREKTLWRKANEALIALILDHKYSKDQILEAYINEVYFGQNHQKGIHGLALASQFYFNKELYQLQHHEYALLIGLIKGPSFYNPGRHPVRAKERRDLVLRLMFQNHQITKQNYLTAIKRPLGIQRNSFIRRQQFPAYLDLVKRELRAISLSQETKNAGLQLITGLDPILQLKANKAIPKGISILQNRPDRPQLQAAFAAVNFEEGSFAAIVGDKNPTYWGFNRALDAKRPVGSLIKPWVYLTALEHSHHYHLGTMLKDSPIQLKNESGQMWEPKNFDRRYRQQVLLHDALTQSLNIPTVNLAMQLGIDQIANNIERQPEISDLPRVPSLVLGSATLSAQNVAQMYATLASHGIYERITAITSIGDGKGRTIWQKSVEAQTLFDQKAVSLVNNTLMDVIDEGTAKALHRRFPNLSIASKTGSSNDLRDSWFTSFDQDIVTVFWVGNDQNKPMGLTGSQGAMYLYETLLGQWEALPRYRTLPLGVELVYFDRKTGKPATQACHQKVELPAIVAGLPDKEQCLPEQSGWF